MVEHSKAACTKGAFWKGVRWDKRLRRFKAHQVKLCVLHEHYWVGYRTTKLFCCRTGSVKVQCPRNMLGTRKLRVLRSRVVARGLTKME